MNTVEQDRTFASVDALTEAMSRVDEAEQSAVQPAQPPQPVRPPVLTREQIAEREAWLRKLRLPVEQAFINMQIEATGKVELDETTLWEMDMLRSFVARAHAKVAP